jgi:hypothetical protein
MDYRGFYVSGLDTSGNPNLPDPIDVLNVKTLNIVDDLNVPYYTLPRETVDDVEGSVAVFKPNGTSALEAYTSPVYLYYQEFTLQRFPLGQLNNIVLYDTGLRSRYNISLINPNTSDSSFRMPIGTYLINCNFNFFAQGLVAPSSEAYGIYVSVNGQILADTKTAPFNNNQGYSPNIPVGFNQIININSPTDTVQIKIDTREFTSTFLTVDVYSFNIAITKIAPNYTTNILPYFGSYTLPGIFTDGAMLYDFAFRQKQLYNLPYSLIGIDITGNTQTKQFFDPIFGSYNCLHLVGDPAPEFTNYTLHFSGILQYILSDPPIQFVQFEAVLQSSVNGINWSNLDGPTTVYRVIDYTGNNKIPISLVKYNFIPQGQNTYIRVLITLIPNNTDGQFPRNVVIYVNNYNRTTSNSFFAIYKTNPIVSGLARYNIAMRDNGYDPVTYFGMLVAGSELRLTPEIEGVPINPPSQTQLLLPLVINNFAPDTTNNTLTNVRMVYRNNNFKTDYGLTFSEIEFLTPLTNYTITHRFNARFQCNVTFNPAIRVYINGVQAIYQIISASSPANTSFDVSYIYTIPSIAAGDKMFLTFEYNTPANNLLSQLQFLNNGYITFGY